MQYLGRMSASLTQLLTLVASWLQASMSILYVSNQLCLAAARILAMPSILPCQMLIALSPLHCAKSCFADYKPRDDYSYLWFLNGHLHARTNLMRHRWCFWLNLICFVVTVSGSASNGGEGWKSYSQPRDLLRWYSRCLLQGLEHDAGHAINCANNGHPRPSHCNCMSFLPTFTSGRSLWLTMANTALSPTCRCIA